MDRGHLLHSALTCPPAYPLGKFYIEQMFVLVRMQLRNQADTRAAQRFKQ